MIKKNLKNITVVVLALSLSLCLLAPYWKKDQFPYTGVWILKRKGVDTTAISFNSLGACSINHSYPNGQPIEKSISCRYEMSGRSAVIKYTFKYLYNKNNAADQLVLSEYKAKVTPENEGEILKLDLLEAQLTYRKQGKIWQKELTKFQPNIRLRKQ